MRSVLLRTIAVFGIGLVGLAVVLYYASTVDSKPPEVKGVALTQHLGSDDNVALTTTSIRVDFSEPVEHGTAEAAFRVQPAVRGTFSWSGSAMLFTPVARLPLDTSFTARVAPGVQDRAGNRMGAASAAYSFRTVGQPSVVASTPAAASRGVALDANLEIQFSTLMDTAAVERALEIVPATAHRLRWNAERLTIVPLNPLSPNTDYQLSIGRGARDVGGLPLGDRFSLTFTTAPSGVAATTLIPADGTQGIAATTPIAVVFDRAIDPASISNETVRITPSVAGSVELTAPDGAAGLANRERRVLRFQPSAPLAPTTTYEVSLGVGIRAADGSHPDRPLSWSFTTGAPSATLSNQIMFLTDRGGVANLWAMNPDGTNQRQLSAELSPVVTYAIAADGRSFVVGDGARLVEQRTDGSQRRVLTDAGSLEFDPSYAPDGTKIAFGRADATTGAALGIWERGVGGGDARQLVAPDQLIPSPGGSPAVPITDSPSPSPTWTSNSTSTATPTATPTATVPLLRAPVYSPEGGLLAFVDDAGRVDVLDLASGRITTTAFTPTSPPVWVADGSALLMSGFPEARPWPALVPGQVPALLDPDGLGLSPNDLSRIRLERLDIATGLRSGLAAAGAARPAADRTRVLYTALTPGRGTSAGVLWLTEPGGAPTLQLLRSSVPNVISAAFTPEPDRVVVARQARQGASAAGGIWLASASTGDGQQLSSDGWLPRWLP